MDEGSSDSDDLEWCKLYLLRCGAQLLTGGVTFAASYEGEENRSEVGSSSEEGSDDSDETEKTMDMLDTSGSELRSGSASCSKGTSSESICSVLKNVHVAFLFQKGLSSTRSSRHQGVWH